MNEPKPPILRIRDWDRQYENNRSRDMKRTGWFPVPNDLSANPYVELVSHDDGPAHFGTWVALLMVASRAKPRGHLVREDGRPHTPESLARLTRIPVPTIQAAIERLLEIGLLETGGNKPRKKSSLPPHPRAGNPQDPAGKPQEGAVEGKGTEHHHQEKKRNGIAAERRTEPEGTEGADANSKPEHAAAAAGGGKSPLKSDDEQPPVQYASPEDELKAIYFSKTQESITAQLLEVIRNNLELSGVAMADFIVEVRKHVPNKWKNPAGLLRDLSKRFRTITRPASAPVTAAEAAAKNYQCPICKSRTPGEGTKLGANGKLVPCTCASEEYIARNRARGIFAEEPAG